MLDVFWRDESDERAMILEIETWVDVLEGCTGEEMRRAWARYLRDGPRRHDRRLVKPDAGLIWRMIMEARPPKLVPKPPEPEEPRRERVTASQREAIFKDAGFRVSSTGRIL